MILFIEYLKGPFNKQLRRDFRGQVPYNGDHLNKKRSQIGQYSFRINLRKSASVVIEVTIKFYRMLQDFFYLNRDNYIVVEKIIGSYNLRSLIYSVGI